MGDVELWILGRRHRGGRGLAVLWLWCGFILWHVGSRFFTGGVSSGFFIDSGVYVREREGATYDVPGTYHHVRLQINSIDNILD